MGSAGGDGNALPRPKLSFSRRDLAAAIRTVQETTGRTVAKVEIGYDGRIIVELAPPVDTTAPAPQHEPNEWDEVLGHGRPNTA
jgi:hypothetical protein